MADDPEARHQALRQFMEEAIPYNRMLGLRVHHLEVGVAVLRLPWRPDFVGDPFRPAVHGGVLSMLVDTAGGAAVFSALESLGDRCSTVDMRVDYLRPGPAADLFARAEIVRMGNRVAVTRTEVRGERPDGVLVATGQAVYNVVRAADRD